MIQRNSAVSTLKEMLVIISGITITNSMLILVAGGNFAVIATPIGIEWQAWLLFGALLLNTVRFYLGNVRILDDCYLSSVGRVGTQGTDRLQSLPLDYGVILVTGVLLAMLSFYIRDSKSFFLLFAVILAVDIVWYVSTMRESRERRIRRQRRWWTINNVVAILPAAYGFYAPSSTDSLAWLVPAGAVYFNTIVDFALSWRFYFHTGRGNRREKLKVFLAAPFTQAIEKNTSSLNVQFRENLEALIKGMEDADFEVFSAHRAESWGAKLDPAATALIRDMQELHDSDIMVGILGSPPSPGVQMEFGAAIIMRKPIIYAVKNGDKAPYLTDGIPAATKAMRVSYSNLDQGVKQIIATLVQARDNQWHE